jgi:hypothetical protein
MYVELDKEKPGIGNIRGLNSVEFVNYLNKI